MQTVSNRCVQLQQVAECSEMSIEPVELEVVLCVEHLLVGCPLHHLCVELHHLPREQRVDVVLDRVLGRGVSQMLFVVRSDVCDRSQTAVLGNTQLHYH